MNPTPSTVRFDLVRLETKGISDEASFHRVFAETMGFPDFYGRNMNAWIDCMSYLGDADAGMSRYSVAPGGLFHLEVADSEDFQRRVPEVFQAFIECTAFVNQRCAAAGEPPILALIFL